MKPTKRLTKELKSLFPQEFLWGASVSAHQVDGGHYNQWTVWEQEHAAESAQKAFERWQNLPRWSDLAVAASDPATYISGKAVEHRALYEFDLKLARDLGLNCFRFSIEWSDIEPEEGVFRPSAIEHYRNYISAIARQGLMPIPTLWHWTLPVWFSEKGGFSKSRNLRYWERFVQKLSDELNFSSFTYVLTVNEPNTYMGMSYVTGEFPPGQKNYVRALWVYRNLARAHHIAYKILKTRHQHLQISPALQINAVKPLRQKHIIDRLMVGLEESYYWWFFRLSRRYDFVGMNHYFTDLRHGLQLLAEQPQPHNDMGFFMDPAGIERAVCRAYKKLKRPILIAENGVADIDDSYRLWWLTETVHSLAEARRHGCKLIGYIHWSLLDNFEWQYGWLQKFGLVAVDRTTMKRRVKPSAKTWSTWLHYK